MGHIIYPDEREIFTGRPVPYHDQDAVDLWARHYGHSLLLRFVASSTTDPAERRQAHREIAVCDRKMLHWSRHRNWDAQEAARERARADALWVVPGRRVT